MFKVSLIGEFDRSKLIGVTEKNIDFGNKVSLVQENLLFPHDGTRHPVRIICRQNAGYGTGFKIRHGRIL